MIIRKCVIIIRETKESKHPRRHYRSLHCFRPVCVWRWTMDSALVDRRVENDENCNDVNAKRTNMRRTLKPSRPKKDGRKRFGRRNKRPQSGKPRRRVRFSMDADAKQTRPRPQTAGAKRRHISPYSSNQGVQNIHPDLQKYAKYADRSNIPKPVRSVAANNITKPATAPESSITDGDGQMSSQMPSPACSAEMVCLLRMQRRHIVSSSKSA